MDFQGRYLEIWVAYIPMNFMCDNVLVCHREVHHAEASLLTTIFPEKIRKYVITTIENLDSLDVFGNDHSNFLLEQSPVLMVTYVVVTA